MLNFPISTNVKRQLSKKMFYSKFGLTTSQCADFDNDISRIDIMNWISPMTIPAIAEGTNVHEFYLMTLTLKRKDYQKKNVELIAKLIPQYVLFALQYENETQLAIFQEKLFVSPWYNGDNIPVLQLNGLNLDRVWENLVMAVGDFSLRDNHTLKEQIIHDEAQAKLRKQIEVLEKRCRAERQPRKKMELFEELKRLKQQL